MSGVPEVSVPRIDALDSLGFPDPASWSRATSLGTLRRAQDGGTPRRSTQVKVGCDHAALHVRFDCDGGGRRCRHVRRDSPLWEEDVVEVFLSDGADTPARYVEIEVNPAGAVFDAIVDNPHGRRETMRVDAGWDAAGLRARVARDRSGGWTVELVLPWPSILDDTEITRVLRANFFRIDKPRDETTDYCAWSPTLVDPPDFHKPNRFGVLRLR